MNKRLLNTPSDILSSWLALEVLSPQTFINPEDLTGSLGSIVNLNEEGLPWEGGEEKSKPNYRLYYQVIVGTINFGKAITSLLNVYADTLPERQVSRGEAILAAIVVDSKGLAVARSVSISSFPWGFARALQRDLSELATWPEIENELNERFEERLKQKDREGNQLPVNKDVVNYIKNCLVEEFGVPVEYITDTCLAVRTYQYIKNAEPPEPMLLNSFFLADLTEAKKLFKDNRATINLKRYLGKKSPVGRIDILNNDTVLEEIISPSFIPLARWPGPGRHPLVLLQQAAVNVAFKELKTDGILAVNGPPGTGKTTLLRDIIAGVICKRAEAMSSFRHPADAFRDSGEKMFFGQGFFKFYHLDPAVKGFEILIASSNNKAVENVSAELPGINAIAEDADELRYFTGISDALINRESWGLIAAVLGNTGNLNSFRQKFWWDKDVGLATYLTEAAGTPQYVEDVTANRTVETRKPRIVIDADAPAGQEEALIRWREAKSEFQQALEDSRRRIAKLERIRKTVSETSVLEQKEVKAKRMLAEAEQNKRETGLKNDAAESREAQCWSSLEHLILKMSELLQKKPSWWARLFNTKSARVWKAEYEKYKIRKEAVEKLYKGMGYEASETAALYNRAVTEYNKCYQSHQKITDEVQKAKRRIDEYRQELGSHLIDEEFFRLAHQQRHLISPWCDHETQLLRDEVFVKAVKLHKAFIDAAARPLKHNLGILMQIFSGQGLNSNEQVKLLPELWSSLFIVVPGLSTTFASVNKMLGRLPAESIGWLLIDEAGQALPQAAVGAVMRSRRAVVVGDPIQIEPVVVLPEMLTQSICKSFGVDPLMFNAPIASAQTLADAATPYSAEFDGKMGSRVVGVPLLVHRRCEDPMFSVSNVIAYERLMVKAKSTQHSAIRDCLGQSVWIDVPATTAQDKWSLEEGLVVTGLLDRLRSAGVEPNLYIITPFVIVAERLRSLIRKSDILNTWVDQPEKWLRERIGTVHTVQGRESEAVFFVLGASLSGLEGARVWAGKKPNLANVAVTRAKEVIYVIGNRSLWKRAGVFRELVDRLPVSKL